MNAAQEKIKIFIEAMRCERRPDEVERAVGILVDALCAHNVGIIDGFFALKELAESVFNVLVDEAEKELRNPNKCDH